MIIQERKNGLQWCKNGLVIYRVGPEMFLPLIRGIPQRLTATAVCSLLRLPSSLLMVFLNPPLRASFLLIFPVVRFGVWKAGAGEVLEKQRLCIYSTFNGRYSRETMFLSFAFSHRLAVLTSYRYGTHPMLQ